jgi:hypothetical protein
MKKTEVQFPDALYQKIEGLAAQLQLTVPELLNHAAKEMVDRQKTTHFGQDAPWQFPEGWRLGAWRAPVEDWRLLANEISH